MNNGYIYLRTHLSYDIYNVFKLGRTKNIPDRDSTYITGELIKGYFELVIEIFDNQKYDDVYVEKLLQTNFKDYNIQKTGGTEFYQQNIINEIHVLLLKTNINFKILSKDEINNLFHSYRLTTLINNLKKLKFNKYIIIWKEIYQENNIQPNNLQKNILDICKNKFLQSNILKLIWSCGLGKTYMSLFIVKHMKFRTVVIGVPSLNLADQFKESILSIFKKKEYIFVIGSGENRSTNFKEIDQFLNRSQKYHFIITTYHSCFLLNNDKYKFDFKIGDEAHHLASSKINLEDHGTFLQFHNIKSSYTLFMTATEKMLENKSSNKILYSMDDSKIFGNYLDTKSIKWATENKYITDYQVLILHNNISFINHLLEILEIPFIDVNKQLFLSAYMALKSLISYSDLSHVLIYCNTTEKSDLVNEYIHKLIEFNIFPTLKDSIYYKSLHSNGSQNRSFKKEVSYFKDSKYGIISCVYIFGEGFDLPKLNGVVFAEQMTSEIRIVQSALRPNRMDKNQPNKIAFILLPYLIENHFTEDNSDFEKCRKVISDIGNYDDTIKSKIKVVDVIDSEASPKEPKPKLNSYFKENKELLNLLICKLIHRKSLNSGLTSEQDEYNLYREINKSFKYQTVSEYHKRKDDNLHYLNNPEDYFKKCGVWKNYYDFIGRNNNDLLDLESWKLKCKELEIKTVDDYNQKIKIYNCLPPEPEYYYSSFRGILPELDISIVNTRRY